MALIKKKTCFVISPIGEDGSDVRKNADDLFELVIEPGLQKYDFEVIRADKIPRPSVITADIIQLVQTADLCVIDLTHENANVFYECGRRHETGKPFVQLLSKGEKLPFDVAGIRTISYDLSTPRSVHKAMQDLQQFVDELDRSGFEPGSSGESLSSIASALERIERKITDLVSRGPSLFLSGSPQAQAEGVGNLRNSLSSLMNPKGHLMNALAAGDLGTIALLLPRLEQVFGILDEQYIFAAAFLASAGVPAGVAGLERIINDNVESLDGEQIKMVIGSMCQYYQLTDREEEGLLRLSPLIEAALSKSELEAKSEAWLQNQYSRLLHGAQRYEDALNAINRAVELAPEETSYHFNKSVILESLGMINKAVESVDAFMLLGTNHSDHLFQAVDLYCKVGRSEPAREALRKLNEVNPGVASVLANRDHVRNVVGKHAG